MIFLSAGLTLIMHEEKPKLEITSLNKNMRAFDYVRLNKLSPQSAKGNIVFLAINDCWSRNILTLLRKHVCNTCGSC